MYLPYFVGQARAVYRKIVCADARFNRMVEPQVQRLYQQSCKKSTFRQPDVLDRYRQWKQAGTDYGQSDAYNTLSFDRHLVEMTSVRLAQMEGKHQNRNTEKIEKYIGLVKVTLTATREEIRVVAHLLHIQLACDGPIVVVVRGSVRPQAGETAVSNPADSLVGDTVRVARFPCCFWRRSWCSLSCRFAIARHQSDDARQCPAPPPS